MIYPYNTPQVLTDDIYTAYGGSTGTSTAFQRQVAFLIAEDAVSQMVGTPIVPTIVTGTYFYPHVGRTVQLDHSYLQEIYEIRFVDGGGNRYHTISGVNNYYAAIRNAERSVVDIFWIYGNCRGCSPTYAPYQFEIAYRCGLPTGTYTSPKVLLALTKAAEQELNEILGYGNESVGLVGITEFRNQDYMEKRKGMTNSIFGSTPVAQYIQKLLSGITKLMRVGL